MKVPPSLGGFSFSAASGDSPSVSVSSPAPRTDFPGATWHPGKNKSPAPRPHLLLRSPLVAIPQNEYQNKSNRARCAAQPEQPRLVTLTFAGLASRYGMFDSHQGSTRGMSQGMLNAEQQRPAKWTFPLPTQLHVNPAGPKIPMARIARSLRPRMRGGDPCKPNSWDARSR